MNWIGRFISALYESGEQYHSDSAAGVPAIDATLVSEFLRLPRNLKLLYGFWAASAIATPVFGVYATLMQRSGTSGAWTAPPVAATTVLLLGGIGLLYECYWGIKFDARGEGYASRSRTTR